MEADQSVCLDMQGGMHSDFSYRLIEGNRYCILAFMILNIFIAFHHNELLTLFNSLKQIILIHTMDF